MEDQVNNVWSLSHRMISVTEKKIQRLRYCLSFVDVLNNTEISPYCYFKKVYISLGRDQTT